MSLDPKSFFKLYVLAPHSAWCEDELCEWKAFATASGINALVEHALRAANPTDPINTPAYQQKLHDYRVNLGFSAEHRHIQYVVETYKHVELKGSKKVPGRFDMMQGQRAGAFAPAFSRAFDVVRPQLGFPYDDGTGPTPWIPLRRPVENCVAYWKGHFGLVE
ncbi:hypothetical protein [Rhodopila globiformis]|uniref:Uncharacterized protein n=1 Tax=Rhodopila globiformis TaxID=1071 RepID=A0A2S6NP45_RHOGL|nr:hypothetical protein [Rhodopila globiformis]PPQ40130.1 hypothetical protein CCS01_00680 [Rhodopila globiformis]